MAKISLIAAVGAVLMVSSIVSGSFVSEAMKPSTAHLNALVKENEFTLDEAHVKYYMALARGGLNGYRQGFYDNATETISQECLGETTYKHLNTFFTMLNSGKIMEIFKSIGVFYQFSFDVQKQCRSNEMSFDLVGFCLNTTTKCSIPTIVENVQVNIFKLTSAANQIAETAVDYYTNYAKEDITNLNAAATKFTNLGMGLGKMIRTVLGFTLHEGHGRKPKNPVTPVVSLF